MRSSIVGTYLKFFFFSVTYGVNSKEQRSIVRTFLQNIYQVNIDQIVTAVMNEYTDYRHTGENKMTNRDTLLDIFSDARVAAPVLKAASLHAEAKEANQAYLYVFKHVTKKGYYSEVSSTESEETLETVWFLFLEFNHNQFKNSNAYGKRRQSRIES
jgi:neuroligin